MSGSSRELRVTAADGTAEISVLDGRLNRVAWGLGEVRYSLPQGLYKVRVRVGPSVEEQLVSLDRNQQLRTGASRFFSPIPLENTSRSHEYHQAAAVDASRTSRDKFGAGASVLVFARDWSASSTNTARVENPARGLSFRNEAGSKLALIDERADLRATADASAGWRADVTPGAYRLRLDLPDGTALERALFASPNTQTQIFLLQHDFILGDGSSIRRADLFGGAIAISLRNEFSPNDQRTRLAELARYALVQGRQALSDALLNELLYAKFECPMLGLLGAHLLLRDRPGKEAEDNKPDEKSKTSFDTVTDNLRLILGEGHPDLCALWLRRTHSNSRVLRSLSSPPMLRSSWNVAVQESVRAPDIIPLGVVFDSIADRILPTTSWLLWQADAAAQGRVEARLTALENYLRQQTRLGSKGTPFDKLENDSREPNESIMFGPAAGIRRSAQRHEKEPEKIQTPAPEKTLTSADRAEFARSFGVSGHVLDAMLKKLSP